MRNNDRELVPNFLFFYRYGDKPKEDIVIADSGVLPVDVIEHAEL